MRPLAEAANGMHIFLEIGADRKAFKSYPGPVITIGRVLMIKMEDVFAKR